MLALLTGAGRVSGVSHYGAPTSENCPQHYDFGAGIVGQCAKDRTPFTLNLSNDLQWNIRTGLVEVNPHQVLVFPVEHGGA